MNRQAVFDKVAKHLFAQGKRATTLSGTCMYRGPGNTKCAIGCLIPDEVYQKDFEENTVNGLLSQFPHLATVLEVEGEFTVPLGVDRYDTDMDMLKQLQRIHDFEEGWISTEVMKAQFHRIANGFGLNEYVLEGLSFSDR